MRRLFVLAKTEGKLTLRSPDVFLFVILMPVAVVSLIGILYGGKDLPGGVSQIDMSFGAYLSIGIAAVGLMGMPLVLADYREKKVLKRLQVTPVSPALLLGAQLLVQALMALVSALMVTAVAVLFFGLSLKGSPLAPARLESSINQIQTQENCPMNDSETTVIDKDLPTRLAVCYRFTGRYPEIGEHIGKVFRTAGGKADGPPFCLYHDGEYREEDADIEIALPVKRAVPVRTPGVEIREIPGGPALTLIHTGPYTTLTSSYRRLMDALKERGLTPLIPSREVYLKGPGMIFRGNPAKYRTEIQMPYEPSAKTKRTGR